MIACNLRFKGSIAMASWNISLLLCIGYDLPDVMCLLHYDNDIFTQDLSALHTGYSVIGTVSARKVNVPKPKLVSLPSLRSETGGNDPNVNLVVKGWTDMPDDDAYVPTPPRPVVTREEPVAWKVMPDVIPDKKQAPLSEASDNRKKCT